MSRRGRNRGEVRRLRADQLFRPAGPPRPATPAPQPGAPSWDVPEWLPGVALLLSVLAMLAVLMLALDGG